MANAPDDIFTAQPTGQAKPEKIAILTADGTEDQEFFYPYYRFTEEGYQVDVFTPQGGEFKGKNGAGLKQTMKVSEAEATNYAFLYIPGGKAPEKLKLDENAVTFVQEFANPANLSALSATALRCWRKRALSKENPSPPGRNARKKWSRQEQSMLTKPAFRTANSSPDAGPPIFRKLQKPFSSI
jgi:hypothetical protein